MLFYPANHYFGGMLRVFLQLFWPKPQLCRIKHYKNPNKNSWQVYQKGHQSCEGNERQLFWPTSPHSTKPNPILKQYGVLVRVFWSKAQRCRIVHYKNTYKKLITSSSERCMSPGREINGTFLEKPCQILQSQPPLWTKFEYFCGYFDQKRIHVGLHNVRKPIKTH